MTTEAISLTESKQLVSLEKTIEAGQKTFVEVGLALAAIRDGKLYRADHSTFEDYCKEKWGWTKQHVYRLIECAPIAKSNPQVTSLNQAREIAKAAPENRAAVIEAVAAKGQVTARAIRSEIQDAVVVVKPTEDSKWLAALGKTNVEPPLAELTPLQQRSLDLDYVCATAIETLDSASIGQFKLSLAVWIKKLTAAQKSHSEN